MSRPTERNRMRRFITKHWKPILVTSSITFVLTLFVIPFVILMQVYGLAGRSFTTDEGAKVPSYIDSELHMAQLAIRADIGLVVISMAGILVGVAGSIAAKKATQLSVTTTSQT